MRCALDDDAAIGRERRRPLVFYRKDDVRGARGAKRGGYFDPVFVIERQARRRLRSHAVW